MKLLKSLLHLILLISVIFCFADCNVEKSKNETDTTSLLPLFLQSETLPQNSPDNEPPSVPVPPIIPNEIVSLSPEPGSTYFVDYNDIGLKPLHETCTFDRDGTIDPIETRIRRILPTTKIILEVKFLENVTEGQIKLSWKGIDMPGTLTYLDSKTVRFETLESAYVSITPMYRANAFGFISEDKREVPPANWQFQTDFNGVHQHITARDETCTFDQNGNRQCKVKTSKRGDDGFQEFVSKEGITGFYNDVTYHDEAYNYLAYSYIDCPEKTTDEKEFLNEVWFIEMDTTFAAVPDPPPGEVLMLDSYLFASHFIPSEYEYLQYEVFPKKPDLQPGSLSTSKKSLKPFRVPTNSPHLLRNRRQRGTHAQDSDRRKLENESFRKGSNFSGSIGQRKNPFSF